MKVSKILMKSAMAIGGLVVISVAVSMMATQKATWLGEIVGEITEKNIQKSGLLLSGIIIFIFIDAILTIIEGKLISLSFDKPFKIIRESCFERIIQAEIKSVEQKYGKGNLIARTTLEIDELNELFTSRFTWFARTICLGVFSLGVCVFLSWKLSLVFFALIPIFMMLGSKAPL